MKSVHLRLYDSSPFINVSLCIFFTHARQKWSNRTITITKDLQNWNKTSQSYRLAASNQHQNKKNIRFVLSHYLWTPKTLFSQVSIHTPPSPSSINHPGPEQNQMTTVIQAQDSFVTNTAFSECISTAFFVCLERAAPQTQLLLPPERPDYLSQTSRTGREEGYGANGSPGWFMGSSRKTYTPLTLQKLRAMPSTCA